MLEDFIKKSWVSLEKFGMINVVRLDAFTAPSGVAAPIRMGYAIDPKFLFALVFLFILYKIKSKYEKIQG
jgi:hypothetical protein